MKRVIFILSVCLFLESNAQNSNRTHVVNGKVIEPKEASNPVSQGDDTASKSENDWSKFAERFVFLSDGTYCVMLPKGAVINLPAGGRITLQDKVVGEWIEWDEFFTKNRNALRLESVSFNQLQGLEPIDPDLLTKIKAEKIPVITAYNRKVVAMPSAYLNSTKP